MSDDVRRVEVWTDRFGEEHIADHVERLKNGTHALMPLEEYDRLRAELNSRCDQVERLQQERDEMNCKMGVWITDEQIDKVWNELHRDVSWGRAEAEQHDEQRRVVKSFLAMIGIVKCPECEGTGHLPAWPDNPPHRRCPRCQGHRWIREERGDD